MHRTESVYNNVYISVRTCLMNVLVLTACLEMFYGCNRRDVLISVVLCLIIFFKCTFF